MKKILFHILIVYYFVLNYFTFEVIDRFSAIYFLLTVPVLLFVIWQAPSLIQSYTQRTLALLALLLMITSAALLRGDFRTIISAFLLLSTVIVVINGKFSINLRLVNGLFILGIIGSVISYHAGINVFGYIPDLKNISRVTEGGVGIKISLFPLTPESAFFSLFVVIYNYYFNPSKTRYLFYIAAFYFLVFSGSRTALAVFAFFVVFEVVTFFITFRPGAFYKAFNFMLLLFFILISDLKSFHIAISRSDNELLKAIVLREEQEITDASDTQDVSTRMWIWGQHLHIFSHNPWIGVGTYTFGDYVTIPKTKVYHFTTGSESFLTAWLARVGVCFLLFVLFLVLTQNKAIASRNKFMYIMTLFLFLVTISYGSFVVPYNFMFLLMVASIIQAEPETIESVSTRRVS